MILITVHLCYLAYNCHPILLVLWDLGNGIGIATLATKYGIDIGIETAENEDGIDANDCHDNDDNVRDDRYCHQ